MIHKMCFCVYSLLYLPSYIFQKNYLVIKLNGENITLPFFIYIAVFVFFWSNMYIFICVRWLQCYQSDSSVVTLEVEPYDSSSLHIYHMMVIVDTSSAYTAESALIIDSSCLSYESKSHTYFICTIFYCYRVKFDILWVHWSCSPSIKAWPGQASLMFNQTKFDNRRFSRMQYSFGFLK